MKAFSLGKRTIPKTKKAAVVIFSVVLLAATAAALRAQSALDGFDPNADDIVRAVVVQPDGKILLAGDFTTLTPSGGLGYTQPHRPADADGTFDTTFDSNANNFVNSIAVPDGRF